MSQTLLYLYVVAVGFAAAGICTSLVQLLTGQPLKFAFKPETFVVAIVGVFVRVMGGPAILMRNAIRGARIEGREAHWLALSTLIATFWSFFSGAVILETAVLIGS